ncbi:caspase family protein [Oscillatoria sp. FACHB-1406]|uniref:caspase family protein n=1 Tax=Oscillatoria sp. FACHB-1406 TaxID=2692846 RepID=UPI0016886D05|nr:caspase family protein [Oscillatoria sp. FACHB-1406]MBD2577293.1 caspase family protein [Oscillatoria sp. FACHB-1406]
MPKLSRRHLLQAAGATLLTAGLHQTQLLRHQKVLAQTTPRKLALIIGINDYIDAPLYGCVNDAILQRQLLIHRFGFNPSDIVMVLNQDATRQNILDAVEEHLIKQAKPGDVAVLHFSGHGSLVRDPDPIYIDTETGQGLAGTLVPIDASLSDDAIAQGGTVADILGHTLFLLMAAIQTENLTAVLDSCHSGASTRGVRVRAREGGEKIEISPQEKAYQEQWLKRLGWSREEFVNRYRQGIAKGVVLAATQPSQLALDEQLNGFVAGAFTYRLTQHLWQQDSTPERAIAEIQSQIPKSYRQQPKLEVETGSDYGKKPFYFVEDARKGGQALVIEQTEFRAKLLLVGIDPGKVRVGTEFVTLERRGGVEIEAREGLIATAKISGTIETGAVLRVKGS